MSTNHVEAYFKAMNQRDKAGIVPHLSENIALHSPIFPANGREEVVQVISGLLNTIDSLDVDLTFSSGSDVAVFFTIKCQDITVKGNEHVHIDENGLIDLIDVAWRPLASAVLLQEILATKLGGQPLRLVPASEVA